MEKIIPIIKNVQELAAYVKESYKRDYGREISPLKLQKSLYFLFAYWGGFIRKNKKVKEEKQALLEIDYSQYSEYLYDSKIEAWVYGPVLPDVYHNEKYMDNSIVNLIIPCKFESFEIKEFVDDLLIQIFKISDFRLVDISHSDNVWKKYFDPSANDHCNEMPPEEIIAEYATKI